MMTSARGPVRTASVKWGPQSGQVVPRFVPSRYPSVAVVALPSCAHRACSPSALGDGCASDPRNGGSVPRCFSPRSPHPHPHPASLTMRLPQGKEHALGGLNTRLGAPRSPDPAVAGSDPCKVGPSLLKRGLLATALRADTRRFPPHTHTVGVWR